MLDKKGQAFSVFELMIAGVVAFAILIILLSVVSGVLFNPTNNPRDSISTALKTVGRSAQTVTDTFQIKPNTTIFATNFYDKTGLEATSVKFFAGQFGSNNMLKVDEELNMSDEARISSVTWNGSQALNAKALVLCEVTNEQAANSISKLDSDKYEYNSDELAEYCDDAQPCCAVVLAKP